MKKVLFGFAILTLMLGSCKKENSDALGKIQGMGNTGGNLQVKAPFTLPQGISLVGDITGLPKATTKSQSTTSTVTSCFGSGGKMIKLKLTLLNTGNSPRTVFFPKGLLWECNTSGYQHAICLQTSWVCLKANETRTILLDLYCVNYGLSQSDEKAIYKILGICNSQVIGNLLNLIGWKKINYEMIFGYFGGTKGVSVTVPTYDEITTRMQDIVWNLTNNGKDISTDDEAFIQSIPELDPSEIPPIDSQSQFPVYFSEFIEPGI
jgi:hypothetical protein